MTHVLIFLPHSYVYHTCTRALHMSSPVANRSIVDLGAIVQKNKDTPKAILVMHAPSGTDDVTATYNVGKQLARKVLETTNPENMSIAGDLQTDLDEVCSIPQNVYFDTNIIKIESVLAEIHYFLFWFDAFAAIFVQLVTDTSND